MKNLIRYYNLLLNRIFKEIVNEFNFYKINLNLLDPHNNN